MVVVLERLEARDDWPLLPGIPDIQAKFNSVINDTTSVADKKTRLNALWPSFADLLENSPLLTRPDQAQIASNVLESLKRQFDAPQPFAVAGSLPLEAVPSFDSRRCPRSRGLPSPAGWRRPRSLSPPNHSEKIRRCNR